MTGVKFIHLEMTYLTNLYLLILLLLVTKYDIAANDEEMNISSKLHKLLLIYYQMLQRMPCLHVQQNLVK